MLADGPAQRPVRVAITNRAQSKDIYDPVVYQKGAAVLMMLDGWLGEANVREALRAYLREHALYNANTDDLARALTKQTGKDIPPVFESFLDTSGVPRVRATLLCDPKPHLRIEQTGAHAIPVCFRGPGLEGCPVLDGPVREVELSGCPAWIYLNANGSGYYRTSWSAGELQALLKSGLPLTLAEKLTLVEDLRALKATGPEV